MFPQVAFGVVALVVCAFCLVSSNEDCGSKKNIQRIQKNCRKENQAILLAEEIQDHEEVCRQYPLMIKCAVSELPHCYDYIESSNSLYGHSPFSCQMTPDQIRELQQIINANRVTSTPPPATTSSGEEKHSGTTFLNILTSSTFSRPQNVTGPHPGSNEKHKGGNTHDDGSVLTSNISTMAMLLVTTPLLWWLTS